MIRANQNIYSPGRALLAVFSLIVSQVSGADLAFASDYPD
jgi:hypothetical protein